MPVLVKKLTLTGSLLRPQPLFAKQAIAQGLQETVWPLFKSGRIKPVVKEDFPLERACETHALMETWQHFSKVVLKTEECRAE